MARAQNAIVAQGGGGIQKNEKFSDFISSKAAQQLMNQAIPDAASKARFIGSIVAAVASTPALQECSSASILAAGLRGEGEGLILGIGYYIVPYKPTAVFVRSYKGLIQLALTGGDVADMDCVEVREGEYVGRNRRTKRPEFDFSIYETDEEAEKHPVIGYYAYCEKKDGYFRGEYMSVGAVMDHAEQYSPKNFNREKYYKLMSGEMSKEDADRLRESSAYYKSPDAMFKKTVLRKLLNSGYVTLAASTRVNQAMEEDDRNEAVMDAIGSFDVMSVDPNTGEIAEQSIQVAPEDAAPKGDEKPAGMKRKKKGEEEAPVDVEYREAQEAPTPTPAPDAVPASGGEDDVIGSFFA